jgi:hypothetical protein
LSWFVKRLSRINRKTSISRILILRKEFSSLAPPASWVFLHCHSGVGV